MSAQASFFSLISLVFHQFQEYSLLVSCCTQDTTMKSPLSPRLFSSSESNKLPSFVLSFQMDVPQSFGEAYTFLCSVRFVDQWYQESPGLYVSILFCLFYFWYTDLCIHKPYKPHNFCTRVLLRLFPSLFCLAHNTVLSRRDKYICPSLYRT